MSARGLQGGHPRSVTARASRRGVRDVNQLVSVRQRGRLRGRRAERRRHCDLDELVLPGRDLLREGVADGVRGERCSDGRAVGLVTWNANPPSSPRDGLPLLSTTFLRTATRPVFVGRGTGGAFSIPLPMGPIGPVTSQGAV